MKLRITRYSIDVVKQLQALISNEEIYNGVEAFRRQEVSLMERSVIKETTTALDVDLLF